MFKPRLFVLSSSLVALMALSAQAQTPPADATPVIVPPAAIAPATANQPVMRSELPALVREVLLNDPDIIKDAAQKLREKKDAEAKKKALDTLTKRKDDLFNDPATPSVGDAKTADVTVVEFFDYHCGYCKHMLPVVAQIMKEDPKVRFVFKEYPILSEDSVTAARAALAVNNIAKDKYFDFHAALMKQEGKFDEKAIMAIAKKLGINGDKLKAEMKKDAISTALDKNRELGAELGVNGTPALVVGNEFVPGAISTEDLQKLIAKERIGKMPAAAAPAPAVAPAPVPAAPAAPAPATQPK
jgi:protein-disulfide isomerase